MRHGLLAQGHDSESRGENIKSKGSLKDDFVLEKSIFNNIFEKDIRRVFVYKKAERLAKAVYLIAPAFTESTPLRERIDAIAIGLVDAAILPPGPGRTALARELLTLSSVLAIARTSGLLSAMNADLISREAQFLLQEIAAYEEPRLTLDEVPTLSSIAKNAVTSEGRQQPTLPLTAAPRPAKGPKTTSVVRTSVKDTSEPQNHIKDRREAIVSVIKSKGTASIRDIAHNVRGVSEKTVQRELQALVEQGVLTKKGERRWSTYALV